MDARLRDTAFGQLFRLLSGIKAFPYPDEVDDSLWRKFVPAIPSSEPGVKEEVNETPPASEVLDVDEKSIDDEKLPSNAGASSHEADVEVGADDTADTTTPSPQSNAPGGAVDDEDKDMCVVGWYGSDDPENPQNWPDTWKTIITFQMYILNFSVYVASSIYVPGEKYFIQEFGVSETVATLGLSLYTVGYGLGPMLFSPMSEMPQLGRSKLYVYTLFVFILLQLGAGFAIDPAMFFVFRLVGGFFGSPALVTAAATISDIYPPSRTAYRICVWGAFALCAPALGPLIGGFVAPAKGWRWTIWIYTWLCSFCLVMIFFLLPETSSSNILYRRAKRLRKLTGNHRIRAQSEIDAKHHTFLNRLGLLGRAFKLLFTEPIVFVMDTFTALVSGVFFIWFESFPIVYGDIYGFDIQDQGLAYLGLLVAILFVVPSYLLWIRYGVLPAFAKANFKPEMMLPPTLVGSVALPVCLFWYGWTARESIHWIVPTIGSAMFIVAAVCVFNAVFNYLGLTYLPYSASVFAGNAFLRATFGATFPLFARSLFSRLGVGPGNSLLAGVATLFIPWSFLIYKRGDRIRRLSKKARHDAKVD